jgi:hypothetical protein
MAHLLALVAALFIGTRVQQPAASEARAPWSGRLQIAQGAFVDDAGTPVLPLCAHFGEAFSAWVRRPAEVDAELQAIERAGYDCIRFWDHLGEYADAWRGKEVTPFSWRNATGIRVEPTPGYYEKLEQFLALLKRRGLAAHHSRGDFGRTEPAVALDRVVEHSRTISRIYDRVGWEVLALYEGNNEDFQNGNFGVAGLLRIVEPIKARGGLVASSCPPGCTEDKLAIRSYSEGFSVRYYHGWREGTAADRFERAFTAGYDPPSEAPRLGWDGEPIGPNQDAGPGVTINHTEDVEEIALLHAITLFGRRAGATYMSQHGVFWNGPIHEQPGFAATPRLRAALRDFAPDVMRWNLYHGARREAVLRSPGGYHGDPGVVAGAARIDQAVSPDRRRVVALVYGGKPPARVGNHLGCTARLSIVTPLDTEEVHVETLELQPNADREVHYRVGRLLLGECVN